MEKEEFKIKDIAYSYDELSLWAVPFGLKILGRINFQKYLKVLDLCCGTGFLGIEIAERLGISSKIYGIDLWAEAIMRARYKKNVYDVKNIKFIIADALKIPFKESTFDLIVSNNGINNVVEEEKAIKESFRVCKKGGTFIFTVNLPDTMIEFYQIFKNFLKENKLSKIIEKVNLHIKKHRKSIKEYKIYLKNAGFKIKEIEEDVFFMKFMDGTAFFNHHFIKFWFFKPWLEILENLNSNEILKRLEEKLNNFAKKDKALSLTIPFVCFKCEKE